MTVLLDVQDVHVRFRTGEGTLHAVNGVSFDVKAGEWLGVVGESGSGKSVLLLSLLGLIADNGKITNGQAHFQGQDLIALPERKLRRLRGQDIGVVFQNLSSGLNPYLRIGQQIMEPMLEHRLCTKAEAKRRALELLEEMAIPDAKAVFNGYADELSGGMRQRIMIAIALAGNPSLLIADEPTTALDSTVQMQVLSVLQKACERRQMTTVMVTHDIGVATNVCDRVMVIYGGMVMEMADVDDFIRGAAHPYTIGLQSSVLDLHDLDKPLTPIKGAAKTWLQEPAGCTFAERCPFAIDRCFRERPSLQSLGDRHQVACHRVGEENFHAI